MLRLSLMIRAHQSHTSLKVREGISGYLGRLDHITQFSARNNYAFVCPVTNENRARITRILKINDSDFRSCQHFRENYVCTDK